MVDTDAVAGVWDAALRAPEWSGAPVWLHSDLAPGNLLVVDGRLSAVIDFAGVGVGDPAGDLPVVWNLLPADARNVFRAALGVDDATWERGRGWALSIALSNSRTTRSTNPLLAAGARHTIAEVLADHERDRMRDLASVSATTRSRSAVSVPTEVREQLDALAAVLHDCVAGGASVSYMAPFSHEDARTASTASSPRPSTVTGSCLPPSSTATSSARCR